MVANGVRYFITGKPYEMCQNLNIVCFSDLLFSIILYITKSMEMLDSLINDFDPIEALTVHFESINEDLHCNGKLTKDETLLLKG